VFKAFVLWRILLFVPVIAGVLFLPYRPNNSFTNIRQDISQTSILNNPVIYPWANFDGVHYFSIAKSGYTYDGRFFPLYPGLVHLLGSLLGKTDEAFFIAGFLIANLSFLAALHLLFKIISTEYSEKIAKKTIVYLLCFPTSFFFGALYTESLFLLLAISSFYFFSRNKYLLATLTGTFLSVTRVTGVLILPGMLYQAFKDKNYLRATLLLMMPASILIFGFLCLKIWGDFLYFIHAQGTLTNGRTVSSLVLPPVTLFRYLKITGLFAVHQFEWWIAMLELASFIFGLWALFIVFKKSLSVNYQSFAWLAFLLPVLSGTLSALPRYVLIIFPIFIALALIKSKRFGMIYPLISLPLLFILVMLFSRGYYIS